jgi:hypothetical protein
MGSLTGRLSMTEGGRRRHLDFLEGRIVYASSAVPSERFASWLAADKVLSAVTLRRMLSLSLLRRTLFSDILMATPGVDPTAVRASLTRLAETLTTRILMAPEVSFTFDPSYPVRDLLGLSLDVDANSLLMEAARRSDEQQREGGSDPADALPFSGEAFERFFWHLIREGVTGDEMLDGEQVVTLHRLIRDIMGTLSQWLASSPGLVPLPVGQVNLIAEQLDSGQPVSLDGLPHATWNVMVLSCSVRSSEISRPTTLEDLEKTAQELDLWVEMIGSDGWQRPHAGRLDELTRTVAIGWSRAAGAAAPHFDTDTGTTRLAAHLMAVPTDLVLWVLATLPVPHQRLRQTLLQHLPQRLGTSLAEQADFHDPFRSLGSPSGVTGLGASLHLGRETLPSAGVWPATVPEDQSALLEIADPSILTAAANAARDAAENPDSA